jgi:hypothetical protein
MLVELGFEALEEGKGIGRTASETGQNPLPDESAVTLRALALMTMLPSVTCPSPPMATRLPRRTDRIVVP